MDNSETLIFKADVSDAVKGLETLRNHVNELRNANFEYEKAVKAGGDVTKEQKEIYEKNAAQIKVLNKEINKYKKEIEDATKTEMFFSGEIKNNGDSINDLRNQINNLNKAYDNLSKADREGVAGEKIKGKINELTDVVKAAEFSTQRFQRNVGNYPKTFNIAGESIEKIKGSFSGLIGLGGNVGKAMNAASVGVKGLGTAFITPPMAAVNAVITVLSLLINKLSEAFKKNDDAGTALQSAFAAFQPVLTLINKLFEKVAKTIGFFIEGLSKGVGAIAQFIGGLVGIKNNAEAAANAAQMLVKAEDALEDKEREYTVNTAKREKEINRLKTESRKTLEYDAKTRLAMMEEATRLERIDLDEKLKIAKDKFEIEKAKAAQEVNLSDERKNKLAQFEAELYRAEANHYAGLQRLQMQITTAKKEIAKEEADAVAGAIKAREDELKKLQEQQQRALEIEKKQRESDEKILNEFEQKRIESITDKYAREFAAFQATQRGKIEELKNYTTFSDAAEKARLNLIEKAEKEIEDKRVELQKKRDEEEQKKLKDKRNAELNSEIERLDLLLNAVKKFSDEELQIKLERINIEQARELELKGDTEEKKNAIIAKYNLQRYQAEEAMAKNAFENQRKIIENNFIKAQELAGQNRIQAATAVADMEKDKLQLMKDLNKQAILYMYGNFENYNIALIQQTQKTNKAIDEIKKVQQSTMESQLSAMGAFTGAVANLFNEIGDDSEEWAKYKFALTTAQIGIDTALAISGAVAANTQGDPYTMVFRIAAAVTAAIAAMAQATKELNKTKIPSTPKFKYGGDVAGAGSSESDSILAYLSNGESVINARGTRAYAPLLNYINTSTGGKEIKGAGGATGTGYGLNNLAKEIGKEIAKKIDSMPAPVVSVVEITEQQNKVNFLNKL